MTDSATRFVRPPRADIASARNSALASRWRGARMASVKNGPGELVPATVGGYVITNARSVSRRRALKLAAASAALPLVHIRTGRAAGKVSVGFWDHWVPEGNEIMKKQCAAFGAAHQVEVQTDFITSVGSKNILTIAAEAQA